MSHIHIIGIGPSSRPTSRSPRTLHKESITVGHDGGGNAIPGQDAAGQPGPQPRLAVDMNVFHLLHLFYPGWQLAQADQLRPLDDARLPLPRVTHVQVRLVCHACHRLGIHGLGFPNWQALLLPLFDGEPVVALDVEVPNPQQPLHQVLCLILVAEQKKGGFRRYQVADPSGQSPVFGHHQAALDGLQDKKTVTSFEVMPGVNEGGALLQLPLELIDGQGPAQLLGHLIESAGLAGLVDLGVMEEVGWGLWHLTQDLVHKLFLVLDLQGIVLGQLVLEGAEVTLPDVLTTGGSRPMGGVDPDRVAHFLLQLGQGVVEHGSQLLLGD